MLWLGARAARAPGGGPRPPVAVAAAPAQCPRPAVRAGQPSSARRWRRRGQGCRTVAGAGTRTSASLRRRADAPTPFPASAAVGFARGGAGRPGRRGLFFGNFNECSHLLRRDTLVGWRLCGFALFPRTGAALGTTPGRGTLTDWRCLLSRTLLRMWLRAGLALGQHQGFFALRFSQPPGFPGRVFLRVFSRSGFPGGGVFSASCFRPVLRRLFPEGAVASSSQPRVKGQGCSRQRGGVNPVPHRQRAVAQEHDAVRRRSQVADP